MRKQAFTIVIILGLLFLTWLPSQALNNVIHACAKKKTGQVRVVSDPSQCKKAEYPISWGEGTVPQNPVPNFQGEQCWSIHITEDANPPADGGTALMRVGVTYMGDAYYSLQGFVTIPNSNPVIVDGSAVIVGNEVFVHVNMSVDNSLELNRDGIIGQMRLDISTLNGTIWSIADQFDTVTREFVHYYNAGTVTLTTCP